MASKPVKPRGRKKIPADPLDSKSRHNLAKLLSLLDDEDAAGLERLSDCRIDRLPYLVGVTGAAGVGKSLLLSRLIRNWMASTPGAGPVGVLAVDPTSPVSGGALLGDRVRMPNLPAGVFLRSVATRGVTGGLSEKMVDFASAMKSFGCDPVFIETVGIGQDEWAIRQVADTLIMVEAPGLGDEIQAMKAGQSLVADILVVNKADKPGAAESAAILADTIGKPPLLVSALDGTGIQGLTDALADQQRLAMAPPVKSAADRKKFAWRFSAALGKKWSRRLAQSAEDIVGDPANPSSVSQLYRRIHHCLAFLPDHVAIAVPSLDESIEVFQRLGFFLERREIFPAEKVETAFFNAGGFHIELLKPTSADSPIAAFLSDRQGGLHHIAFEVGDIQEAKRRVMAGGFQTIGSVRPGTRGKQILFLHPKSTCRTLLEFCACDMHADADRRMHSTC